MKFILAEKQEMTQKFAEDGTVIPVTKVVAGPCVVTQIKAEGKDGYSAVQVGFGARNNISKPLKGHLGKLGNFQYLREFRLPAEEVEKLKVGDNITINTFQPGDKIKVTGTSKGKGFQGVVRRWGFGGSPASHGHKDQLRMPGSIGATGPAHVFKGTKMGGRMGGSQVTVSNLEVVEIDPASNSIFIKGAVPGARNNLLLISGAGDVIVEVEKVEEKKETPKAEEKPAEDKKEETPVAAEETKTEEVKEEKVEEKAEEPKEEVKEEKKEEAPAEEAKTEEKKEETK